MEFDLNLNCSGRTNGRIQIVLFYFHTVSINMSLAAVPPLRVTRPYDLQTPIAAWLDDDDDAAAASAVYNDSVGGGGAQDPNHSNNNNNTTTSSSSNNNNSNNKPHFRSREVSHDLAKLQRLRTTIVDVLSQASNNSATSQYDEAAAQLDTFYEYHASLWQCEQHGICVQEVSSPLELPWASAFVVDDDEADIASSRRNQNTTAAAVARRASHNQNNYDEGEEEDDDDDNAMDMDDRRGRYPHRNSSHNHHTMEIHASITWERINILWNIVALEAYLASTQPLTTRQGWIEAAIHLEKGAGILRYLRNDVLHLTSSSTSSSSTASSPRRPSTSPRPTRAIGSPPSCRAWTARTSRGSAPIWSP